MSTLKKNNRSEVNGQAKFQRGYDHSASRISF